MLHGFDGKQEGAIKIRFNLLDDEVRILFSDDGVGVKEESFKKII